MGGRNYSLLWHPDNKINNKYAICNITKKKDLVWHIVQKKIKYKESKETVIPDLTQSIPAFYSQSILVF